MKKRRGVQTRRRGLKYIPGKAQVLKRTHTREKQSALTRLKTQGQFAHGTGGLAEWTRPPPETQKHMARRSSLKTGPF